MSLNPDRDRLSRSGLLAANRETPFKATADVALAGFRAVRAEAERGVRSGELTPKVARRRAEEAARALRESLQQQSEGYSPVPRAFLDRLVAESEARRRARENQSLESLQRETNRLLRESLVEQQIINRAFEFEGRSYLRPLSGGTPSPTLDGLLTFHESSRQAGDEAALEWARRQLEGMRGRTIDPADHRRIDAACDRPDRINPRTIGRYVEALRGAGADEMETFIHEALAGGDACACAAAFLLAREAPEGLAARWVRAVLDGLAQFPDAALTALRSAEAEARGADADAARAQADYAIALAEAEARLVGVEPPDDATLDRRARVASRPLARDDEPIGLALDRRGRNAEEFDALASADDGSPADA